MLNVLIADDELPARVGLRTLLARHPDIHIVGEATSGAETVAAITTSRPDVVFLDVQMPDGDGFSVIRDIGVARMPLVIFSTAFDHHALQAFDAHALDYLLKPYDQTRLDAALTRARTQHVLRQSDGRLAHLLERLDGRSRWLQRIVVRHGARAQFVPTAGLDYLEAEGNYVRLHAGDKSWIVRETLAALESNLDPARFLRVHRSIIVHLPRVVASESLYAGEYVLTLANGSTVTAGRSYRVAVQDALGL
ncbi:LytR/AlgR family response regulator transcription factor [Gemmatimonas sp.]